MQNSFEDQMNENVVLGLFVFFCLFFEVFKPLRTSDLLLTDKNTFFGDTEISLF